MQLPIHLRIIFFSDIVTLNGEKLTDEIEEGISRKSCLQWPATFPKKNWKKLWRELLTQLRPHFMRHLPLGGFSITPHQIWPVKSTDEISFQSRTTKLASGTNITWAEIIGKVSPNVKRLLGKLEFYKEDWITWIKKSDLIAGSDGSVILRKGTVAWSIFVHEKEIISAQIPANGPSMDSHRAELTGMLSFLTFLDLLGKYYGYKHNFTFYCDKEGAIKIANNKEKRLSADEWDRKHGDLQECIRRLLTRYSGRYKFKHIASHQAKMIGPIDLKTHINVLCDKRAGQYQITATSDLAPRSEATVHPILGGQLTIAGKIITEKFEDNLKMEAYKRDTEFRLERETNSTGIFARIDWNSMDSFLRKEKYRGRFTKCTWKLWATRKIEFLHMET